MTQKQFNESEALEITLKVKYGQIKTRDVHPVRIICWDAKGEFPIIGLIGYDGIIERPMRYTREGKCDARPNVTTNNDLLLEMEGGEA